MNMHKSRRMANFATSFFINHFKNCLYDTNKKQTAE